LITEHSADGILPEIPGEMLAKIFFHTTKKSRLLVLEKIMPIGGGGKISSLD
jgi:hypothetical protein